MGRKAHPPETRARAAELRGLGHSYKSIGRTLGVGPNTARAWLDPVAAEKHRVKAREYKARRHGVCVECGGPTTLTHDGSDVSLRCKWCAEGKTPPRAPDQRRKVPVRLCDLKPDVLLAGAWEANRYEKNELERQEILLAAIAPSDDVHWVSESARDLLDQVAA